MRKTDDKYVINQVLRGDVSAYSILVERYQYLVFTLAFQLLKNRENAEEVAQDAFFKAYKGLRKFEGRSSFSTWIYRITYREAISRLRKNKERQVDLNDTSGNYQLLDVDEQALKGFENQDRRRFLKEALAHLKSEEAAVLTLFYFDELSVDEISEVTQLSVSNVKVKLHRGRHHLLHELQMQLKNEVNTLL